MRASASSHRLFWIAGVLLLIGTAVGAGFVLNGAVPNVPAAPSRDVDNTPPPGVVAIGYVDLSPGVTNLYPVQPGRVTWVVEEGKPVKKGDVLLRLDSRLAKFRILEAKADVNAARELVRQAQRLPEQQTQKMSQQKAALEASKHQQAIAEQERKLKEKAYNDKVIPEQEKIIAEEKARALIALVQIEDGKLKELNLHNPQVEIARAAADVAAKEARLEQAELALLECDLLAPADGLVLRVLVHEGEVLGANPRSAAVQFAPAGPKIIRAEIMQEWANRVRTGQEVTIEDDTYAGPVWQGKVKRMSQWFDKKRSVILEPFMYNDVRTLECLIDITSEDHESLRIGQRVRITIQSKGK